MIVLRVLAVVVLLVLAVAPAAHADTPSAASLEEQIVCPTCRTTVALSDAPVARRIKLFIRERIAAGDSGDEIKAKLVSQFGAAVLAEPERKGLDLVAWVLPAAGLAIGAIGVGALALAWSRRRAVEEEAALDPELEELLDEELARYDDPV
jgi:cytochrome c-type biogenesis protein CcmH